MAGMAGPAITTRHGDAPGQVGEASGGRLVGKISEALLNRCLGIVGNRGMSRRMLKW